VSALDPELDGHNFELLVLRRDGEQWLAQFAVDGRKYPSFFEPHCNVAHLDEPSFHAHLKSQALNMMEYVNDPANFASARRMEAYA
jgi:hypothetical protein